MPTGGIPHSFRQAILLWRKWSILLYPGVHIREMVWNSGSIYKELVDLANKWHGFWDSWGWRWLFSLQDKSWPTKKMVNKYCCIGLIFIMWKKKQLSQQQLLTHMHITHCMLTLMVVAIQFSTYIILTSCQTVSFSFYSLPNSNS